jgi:hypothetical protein
MVDKIAEPPLLRNQRTEDFASVYSNNVGFEQSVWDLKIIFGQLDQDAGVIEQHTAVTIPWVIAKLSLFYLATQIAGHELVNGKIAIPPSVVPPEPAPLTKEQQNDPNLQKIYAEFTRLHKEFMKDILIAKP